MTKAEIFRHGPLLKIQGLMDSQKANIRWQVKKLQRQGAKILNNEAYLRYAAVARDAAQRSNLTFYKAIKD